MPLNPLISRIWDGFVNPAHDELLAMIEEFRVDYEFDPRFMEGLYVVEDAILEYDYQKALDTMAEIAPYDFRDLDWEIFQRLAEEAYFDLT